MKYTPCVESQIEEDPHNYGRFKFCTNEQQRLENMQFYSACDITQVICPMF